MYNITLTLDGDSRVPLYEQLYRYFAQEIQSGRIPAGTKLPSKRSLCAHLGVSRSTVENGYAILVAEGYVCAAPMRGFFVADLTPYAPPQPTPIPEAKARPQAAEEAKVNFSTSIVDTSAFPYASWAKLNKEVIYNSPELLQRGDRQGEPALRRALAAFLREYRGVHCDADQIVVGAGTEYLIELLLQLFDPEVVFALEDPCYAVTWHCVRNSGRRFRFVPVGEQGISIPDLYASDASVAYITPSHQFPMGVTMPAVQRSRMLHWASSTPERYIIEDDYDCEFRYGAHPIPALQSMDRNGRVVYIGTFSRSLAPSIRVAYMVLPVPLLARYRSLFGHFSSTVSRYEQTVLARFLAEGFYERYLRRMCNLYRQRCTRLTARIRNLDPDIRISGDGGGLHFLLTLPDRSEEELYAQAAEAGIRLHRLSDYAHEFPPRPSTVVLGYGGIRDEELEPAVELLRDAWRL